MSLRYDLTYLAFKKVHERSDGNLFHDSQEFEGSSWEDSAAKAEDNQLFQDDWEDDNTNDDFTQQLRAQIESSNT